MESKNLKNKFFILISIGISLFFLIYTHVYILGIKNVKEKNENNFLSLLFTVNGEKVTTLEIERIASEITNLYPPSSAIILNEDLISTIAVNNFLEKYILLKIAENLKIIITEEEVEKHYIQIKKSYPDQEKFDFVLKELEFSEEEFKKEIKKNLIIKKTVDDFLKKEKEDELFKEIYNIKKSMEIENISEEIEDYIPRVIISTSDIEITNFNIVNRMIMSLHEVNENNKIKTEDDYDLKKIKKKVEENYKNDLLVVQIAKRLGIKVEEYLPVDKKIDMYTKKLYEKIKKDIVPSNEELREYLEDNKDKYTEKPLIVANIAILTIKPTRKDKEQSLKEAQKILEKLTQENFSKEAKEYWKNEKDNVTGGDLGWITRGNGYSKEYEDEIFSAPRGIVSKKILTNDIGSFIFFIKGIEKEKGKEKADVSQIVVFNSLSEETRLLKNQLAKYMMKKLVVENLKLKDLEKYNSEIRVIEKEEIQSENQKMLNNKFYRELFFMGDGEMKSIEIGNDIYIIEKMSQENFEEPSLEDIKTYQKVQEDYLNDKTIILMEKMIYDEKKMG